MITQSYLNTEIDLAKRIFIYYTDKLLDVLLIGNKDTSPWYIDSLQIEYFLNALQSVDIVNGDVYIGDTGVGYPYLSGLSFRIREFLNSELRQIVYAELDTEDHISTHIPSEPPTVILVSTPPLGWAEYEVVITQDDVSEVTLPFNISVADIYSLSVTVNDNDPISLAAPDEEGCHIIGTTLYWHNYYDLKTDDILVIKFQQIA